MLGFSSVRSVATACSSQLEGTITDEATSSYLGLIGA